MKATLFANQRVLFSASDDNSKRSSLFNNSKLRELRQRIRKEDNEYNRYERDATKFKTSQENPKAFGGVRTEMIYSSDLDSVLSLLHRSIQDTSVGFEEHYEFFFACLDRLDLLITEKDSLVDLT